VNVVDTGLFESSLSDTVHVIVVVPIAKVEPDGVSHVTGGSGESSSAAVGGV
jgi:hypothetical protein